MTSVPGSRDACMLCTAFRCFCWGRMIMNQNNSAMPRIGSSATHEEIDAVVSAVEQALAQVDGQGRWRGPGAGPDLP